MVTGTRLILDRRDPETGYTLRQVLRELQERKLEMYIAGGALKITPRTRMTPELSAACIVFHGALMDLVTF